MNANGIVAHEPIDPLEYLITIIQRCNHADMTRRAYLARALQKLREGLIFAEGEHLSRYIAEAILFATFTPESDGVHLYQECLQHIAFYDPRDRNLYSSHQEVHFLMHDTRLAHLLEILDARKFRPYLHEARLIHATCMPMNRSPAKVMRILLYARALTGQPILQMASETEDMYIRATVRSNAL